ncbi:MAG: SGNH hydrolase domain-containing protein [Solirubrobacteraceae bacterium]
MPALAARGWLLGALALLAAPAPAIAVPDAQAAVYRSCNLSLKDHDPPGGTPAYDLGVRRRGTSCRTAIKVMKAFHRCRTPSRHRCGRKLLARWRCAGARQPGINSFRGTFTCRSGRRRVSSSYRQATPECFGAAARDPRLPCVNPTLSVFPPLGGADPDRTWGCDVAAVKGACVFGAGEAQARGHFALVGDSHTLHWRSALFVVAEARRWRGYTIATGGCFFSEAVGGYLPGCVPWYRGAQAWFKDHPEVSTVFVTSNADTPVAAPAGKSALDVKVDGFRRAWQALPKTVKHIVVLRDTPRGSQTQLECLKRVAAAGEEPPGPACPLPRSVAVRKDAGVSTALRLQSKRYRYVDLTRYFCDDHDCYGVIGGASVQLDQWGHVVTTFMRTLGPYLLRGLRRLEASW